MPTETFPAETQDTTVTLPAIPAPELAALVQAFIADAPEARERIERGAAYLLGGHLHLTDTCGVYTVDGCEGRVYRASSGSCSCPDSVQRQRPCKHVFAARLLSAASALASWNRRTAGEPTPPPPPPTGHTFGPCTECGQRDYLDAYGNCEPCAYEATRAIGYALTEQAEALLAETFSPGKSWGARA